MRQLPRRVFVSPRVTPVAAFILAALIVGAGSAAAQVPASSASAVLPSANVPDAGADAEASVPLPSGSAEPAKAAEIPAASASVSAPSLPSVSPAPDKTKAESAGGAQAPPSKGGVPKIIKMVTVIAGGVGAISLGLGVGFAMASNSYAAEVDYLWSNLRKDGGSGACNSKEYEIRCRELEGAHNDAQVMKSVAVTSFIFLGVSVGAVGYGVVRYLMPNKATSTKQGNSGPSLHVGAMPGGGAAVLRGTF